MLACVFPGQGSQVRGMGASLFDTVPEFSRIEPEIDRCLGYSLRRQCLDDPQQRLRQTEVGQPCLYVVNALHHQAAVAGGARPAYLSGHSLGELNALQAAGAFGLLTGLRLVQKRGELMARAKNGAMAAVIGLQGRRIREVMAASGLEVLDVASYNAPVQTIVSGAADVIARAEAIFMAAGAQMYLPLPVSAAFHSRHMAPAAREFAGYLDSFSFAPLQIPVVSTVTGEPYPSGDPTAAIRIALARQLTDPVCWTDVVGWLLARGVTTFTETGPGNVLTKLVRLIQQDASLPVTVGA